MRISDWSSDVCSSDLPRRSCARSRVAMRHPASPEISGFFRSWHVLPTFLRSRLMAVRHACRDTAPAENPCAACQSDLSVDRSEERRVGKERVSTCRSRWSPYDKKKKYMNKLYK